MDGIRIPDHWRWMRIQEDLDAGRLWKARDRLQGHLRESPADQDVLDMLGAVWFAMGDLPQAGRHWWLTDRDDESATSARAAFYERFGTTAPLVLHALPRPTAPEHYPPIVRARLEDLASGASSVGVDWKPWDWKPVRESVELEFPDAPLREKVVVTAVVGAVLGLLVIGLASVVSWIVSLFA